MYITTKNEGYDLRERKRVMFMGRIERRKRKGKWYNYISISKNKNIKRVSKRNGVNLTDQDFFFQYRCSAF